MPLSHQLQGVDTKNSLKHKQEFFFRYDNDFVCLFVRVRKVQTDMVIKMKHTLFVCVCAHAHTALISVDGFQAN